MNKYILSIILSICIIILTSTSVLANESSIQTSVNTVKVEAKNNYEIDEIPEISISTSSNIIQKFNDFIGGKKNDTKLKVYNPENEQILEKNISNNDSLSIDKDILTPGNYEVFINNNKAIDFSWGVLTLNTNKNSYRPNEEVYIQIATLSSTGHTLCDSNLQMIINGQDVPVQNSSTCGADNVTDNPDYFAYYQTESVGNHKISLKNLDTGNAIEGEFIVENSSAITIERTGATRINPFKSDYLMTIKITADTPFEGEIVETLPNDFTTTSPTRWFTKLNQGESVVYEYRYQAPKISPEIFIIGPLSINGQSTNSIWKLASDATFQMQTGYYMGNGTDNRAITGVGFQPNLIIIKDDTGNGDDGVIWKSSVMSGEVSAKLGDSEADLATDAIQSLDSDGFTLGTEADVNTANVRFTWVAFSGSDCTSSGTFCVGSYTGDGAATKNITTVGFQPDFVTVKAASGTNNGVYRTSSMGTNVGQVIGAVNESTDGTRFKTLDSTGFTIGNNAQVNTNGTTYWYFAFKTTANAFAVGTFTGNGVDNRAITGVGFQPDYLWIKNSNATVASETRANQTDSSGDYSSGFSDVTNLADVIQSLDSDGFTVGANAASNENTKTIYWIAFSGSPNQNASGTYTMATGTYTGNGTTQSVSSIGFRPDLVIIKHVDQTTDQYAVFRTSLMYGDRTHYFANSAANFTGGITSLDSGGFTLGSNATVNTSGDTYYWTAFGNAYNPETNTGSADFTIGTYSGNNVDGRDIIRLPFQPDLVTIKRDDTSLGGFRTSNMSGDLTGFFSATAEAANWIQAINSDGFELGTAAQVGNSASLFHFFAFKASNTFTVNNYSGTGSAQNITSAGFQPNLIWVKKATGGTARGAVVRTSAQAGDAAQPFLNSPSATTHITGILSNGFSVGTGNLANESSFNYRYAAWKINSAPSTPTLDSPTDTATNRSLTPAILTTATDTDSDYLRYRINLCENVGMSTNCQTFDQTSSQTGWSGQNAQTSTAYTSGTQATYTVQSNLTANTTYYWKSEVKDPGGANTWSATQTTPYSFTTTAAPSAPATPYAEGATNPTGIIDLTPEFSAIHSDSDSDNANYYEIEVNTASNFSGTVMWDTGQTSMSALASGARSTDVSYAGTALSYNGTTYYWRIRFWDVNGAVSSWSTVQNFSTNSTVATPSLDAPTNTATGQSLTPALLTTTTDANSDYLRYKIELCENVGMSTNCQTFDQTSSQTGWSGQNAQTSTAYTSGTQATYTVQSALTDNFTYYWRSYAIDPAGTNTWSSTQGTPYSFTTAPLPTYDFDFKGLNISGITIE